MASGIVIVHEFVGGTEDQYNAVIAAVHAADGSLPRGQSFHLAGPTADGWMIVADHETLESWETFRDETLIPAMEAGIEGGFTTMPSERVFDVHHQQP